MRWAGRGAYPHPVLTVTSPNAGLLLIPGTRARSSDRCGVLCCRRCIQRDLQSLMETPREGCPALTN